MKTRKKTIIFLIMFILVLALALGSTLAWYTAKRSVKGTMLFDKGIFIEFGNVEGETNTRKLLLEDGSLLDISIVPNDVIKIKNPYIKSLTNSVPFYLRAKLEYSTNTSEGLQTVETAKLSEIIDLNEYNQAFNFNSQFLPDSNNDWFYYVADANAALSNENLGIVYENDIINIFADTTMKVANFSAENGSPNDIDNIQICLVVEALQVGEGSSAVFSIDGGVAYSLVTANVQNGSVSYSVTDTTIEILDFNGIDLVINDSDLTTNDKEITIAENAFENLSEGELGCKTLYVYDRAILESLVNMELNSTPETSMLNILIIVTSDELCEYVYTSLVDDSRAGEFQAAAFIIGESEL
ncbi:MAG: hypothetical protein MR024_01160 [Firmicutes bacterium]|nr:hypothetical protein [Bacillota bacterium]